MNILFIKLYVYKYIHIIYGKVWDQNVPLQDWIFGFAPRNELSYGEKDKELEELI